MKLLKCKCSHKFQDETYGKGMRVHTIGNPQSSVKEYRCTVCGNTKQG